LVDRAAARELPPAEVVFDYTDHQRRISLVESLRGEGGYLALTRVTIESLEREDHLLFAAVRDSGQSVDAETCEKLLGINGRILGAASVPTGMGEHLRLRAAAERQGLLGHVAARNGRFLEDEMGKLERWAEDLKDGLERDIKDLDAEIRTAKRDARLEVSLEAKVAAQRRIRDLEAERNHKRRALFDAQDEIDRRKEGIIAQVEARLRQKVAEEPLFTIRWRVR
jgi:adenine-specific DNA-methyltransferase